MALPIPLPSEILAHIITFSDHSTLASWLRVSKSTFRPAAPKLYRHLTLPSGHRLLPFIPPHLLSPYYRRILATPVGWEDSPYSKAASLRLTTRLDVDEDYVIDPDDVVVLHGGLSGNPLPNLEVLAIGLVTSTWDLHVRCEGDHLGFYEQLRPTTLIIAGIDGNQPTDRPAVCKHQEYKIGIPESVTRLVLGVNSKEWLEYGGMLRLWYDELRLDTASSSACQVRQTIIHFSTLLSHQCDATSTGRRGERLSEQPYRVPDRRDAGYVVQRFLMRGPVTITNLDVTRTIKPEEMIEEVKQWMPDMENGVLEGIMGRLSFAKLRDVESTWGIGGYL